MNEACRRYSIGSMRDYNIDVSFYNSKLDKRKCDNDNNNLPL